MINLKKLPGKGLCSSCDDADFKTNQCPLKELLFHHRKLSKQYKTEFYEDIDPANWEEYAIEEPDFENKNKITWCPLYYKKEIN
jgi:hypothetical protein